MTNLPSPLPLIPLTLPPSALLPRASNELAFIPTQIICGLAPNCGYECQICGYANAVRQPFRLARHARRKRYIPKAMHACPRVVKRIAADTQMPIYNAVLFSLCPIKSGQFGFFSFQFWFYLSQVLFSFSFKFLSNLV